VEEDVKDYALFEVNRTEQQYRALQTSLTRWAIASGIGIAAAALFSIVAAWHISRSIYLPIRKLHDVTSTIAREDLELLVTADNADEITELGLSFNIMVGKIRELLAAKIKEQEELKKAELRALQAQINPHFLYNTLDTIIWMAEGNRTHQVVELVRALSRFFRITLSKGKDWITLREEFEHVGSYLAIQKMRYHDILDYRLELADDLQDGNILKLTLQPLVENALYHGIKNKRNGGTIIVRGQRTGHAHILIEVEDQGLGIPLEKLAQLQIALTSEAGAFEMKEAGFGIANVNQRLKLYYGPTHGLSIESQYLTGTRVSFVIPFRRD
jgi:two-component system sensor histidine kinase YesM